MGLGDFFLGSKANYQLLPGMQDSINSINRLSFRGLGAAGKSAKRTIKDLDAGRDVSDMGAFAPLRQEEAADLSDIDMDYMTGANVLAGNAGGDNLNQLNRMRDLAKERRREMTGRQMVGAMGDLRNSATNTLMDARAQRNANLLQQQALLLQARGNQYNANQRSGGILNALIGGAAQVGGAYLGRL